MQLLAPGQTLDGKYQIVGTLGEGGMGVVYEAIHLRLEQRVAVKCLLPALLGDATLVARFEREARAAARLRSRHVVKILDVANDVNNGTPYMVMEYLEGHDLQAEAAASGGRIPVYELTTWICQVAGALAEAHDAGIVHRDLKPSNIFLSEESGSRIAKILDFGIAKASAIVPGITYTVTGSICGTPHYMSPEQATAAEVDGRSDVWSLSVVAYEMLSGRLPFDAPAFTALAVKIVNEKPVPLGQLRPDLPAALCRAVMRGLEKDVAQRPGSMREFAAALAPFGEPQRERLGSQPLQNPESPVTAGSNQALAVTEVMAPPRVGGRGVIYGSLAFAFVLLASTAAGIAFIRRPPSDNSLATSDGMGVRIAPSNSAPAVATDRVEPTANPSSVASAFASATGTASASAKSVAVTSPKLAPPKAPVLASSTPPVHPTQKPPAPPLNL